jgi:PTS system beta-glucosides-specific IIC component
MVAASKESGQAIRFFSLPISNAGYSSSVLPIILIVWLLSYVEPIADRVSPKAIKFFSKPLIAILITGTAGLVVVGPIGYILSQYVADGMNALNNNIGWLVPMLVGGFSPLLVMTGTHYGIIPIGINNRMTLGYDTVLYPGMLGSNVAQGAAALAVSLKTKQKDVKQLASSAGLTAVCGITEPALYGVNLRFKTPLYAAMVGGGIGGLFMGITSVRNYSGGSPGLLTLPSFIGGDNMNSFIFACIGAVISMAVAFVITFVLYKDAAVEEEDQAVESENILDGSILAPLAGEVISLSKVDDATFSEGIVGQGAAILPQKGEVVSPVDGEIITVFNTKHAIAIKSDDGAEILIHIGLETVKLGGKYFEALKAGGDRVKKGDLLMTFDMDKMKEEGYDLVTPVVITNHDKYASIRPSKDRVNALDPFLFVECFE